MYLLSPRSELVRKYNHEGYSGYGIQGGNIYWGYNTENVDSIDTDLFDLSYPLNRLVIFEDFILRFQMLNNDMTMRGAVSGVVAAVMVSVAERDYRV